VIRDAIPGLLGSMFLFVGILLLASPTHGGRAC